MAIINSIYTNRLSLHVNTALSAPVNRISLLTGPNGSGKTQLLSSAARYLVSQISMSPKVAPGSVVKTSGYISGLITQTFSPFSRFPSAERGFRADSFLSVSNNNFYTCIGISQTKSYTARTLTRNTLEEALYRLAASERIVYSLFNVIRNLGYKNKFFLKYRSIVDLEYLRNILRDRGFDAFLSKIKAARYRGDGFNQLAMDSEENYELLASAIEVLGRFQVSEKRYELDFNFYEKNTSDFAAFQSFALLRRLGCLRLEGFYLFEENNNELMDVTQTSSGQQQMLCSMLSLASALKDDSIVLIDEPELSLHPTWQYLYIDSLCAVLKEFQGCHVLIATHSPLIVQQGSKNGADVIRMDEKSRTSKPSADFYLKAYESIESTLLDVFETPVVDSIHLANKVLSIVVSAEENSNNAAQALNSLRLLLDIYSNPVSGDRKSAELIRQAIECLL
ncbi:AAA family ATPase [Pseudomonas yamanorum]|uniref:ATP-binding protein n=1 Tax=Pseudomonas yamanorum TaxID=515393 RepID=A0A7Y8EIR2_9PSED|nr:ATP-binding protein [Pseudomonas yamanorum]NWE15415.1 ATP-binding protein [Pseudomonas yamanorum]